MNNKNIFIKKNFLQDSNMNQSLVSKTGNFFSSLFYKVINSINPFQNDSYYQNPYDLSGLNDPIKYLPNDDYSYNNSIDDYPSYHNRSSTSQNTSIIKEVPADDYMSIDEVFTFYPNIKKEVYKDYPRPIYIPNEEFFQRAKQFVYNNLVPKYQLLKPEAAGMDVGESMILLSIQLTNQKNIDSHYEYLVNQKNVKYQLFIDIPNVIKNFYEKRKKILFGSRNNQSDNSIIKINDSNKKLENQI